MNECSAFRSHGVFSSLASNRIQMLTSINKMFLGQKGKDYKVSPVTNECSAFRSHGVYSSLASNRIQMLTSITKMFLGQE
jgi:hypothetical protein